MDAATLNILALRGTVAKLQTKLARQTNAVKETEQQIAVFAALLDEADRISTKTPTSKR